MAATIKQRKEQLSNTPMLSPSLECLIRTLGESVRADSLDGEGKTVLRLEKQRMFGYLSWLVLSYRQYVDFHNRDILAKRGSATTKIRAITG